MIRPNLSACPLAGTSAAGLSAPPTGLVAVKIYQPGQVPFEGQVFTDPWITGVDLLAQWRNLEPAFNTFDWTFLDCVFSQADQHGKFVVLTLVPGFEAPAWVLRLPGVRSQSFMNAATATAALMTEGSLSLDLDHAVTAGVDFLELYEPDAVNPAMQALLTRARATLPANTGCAPLTLSVAPQTATAGTPATLSAVTDLDLSRGEDINVYQGSALLKTCAATSCSIPVSPGPGTTTYEADVGAPGTPPSTEQAIVSATTGVSR